MVLRKYQQGLTLRFVLCHTAGCFSSDSGELKAAQDLVESTKNEYKREFHTTLQIRMNNFEQHSKAEKEKLLKERDDLSNQLSELQATLLYERQLRDENKTLQGAKKLFATNFVLSFQQCRSAQWLAQWLCMAGDTTDKVKEEREDGKRKKEKKKRTLLQWNV